MNQLIDTPIARDFLDAAHQALPLLVQEVIAICQIASPTGEEERRTAYVMQRMIELGLQEVAVNSVGNVSGRILGCGQGPTVLLAAHIDTVFPRDTNVHVRTEGEILRAPGVGDNSASVAVLLFTAELLLKSDLHLSGDVILVATVGEEGLGNLRGVRAAMDQFGPEVDYVIALDGSLGSMVRQAVGSRRFRLAIKADGGHSWGAFGSPSAVHALARMIALISEIRVPVNPKTTFNIGTIQGGTTVNTIAAEAEALIDLRSLDPEELKRLEDRVKRIVADVARQSGVVARLELLGDRPVGKIPEEHPLCQAVHSVHRHLGIQTRSYPSSTDGNVPLSMGIPAVTVGVTLGGNGHRIDEYIHTTPLARGLGQVLLLVLAAQDLPVRVR